MQTTDSPMTTLHIIAIILAHCVLRIQKKRSMSGSSDFV